MTTAEIPANVLQECSILVIPEFLSSAISKLLNCSNVPKDYNTKAATVAAFIKRDPGETRTLNPLIRVVSNIYSDLII